MDTNDEWIRDRVGIVERRFADKDELLVDMAVKAGSAALADAGLEPSDVDTVIVADLHDALADPERGRPGRRPDRREGRGRLRPQRRVRRASATASPPRPT